MARRRSLDDALTPEQEEFLRGNGGTRKAEPEKVPKPESATGRPRQKPKKENPAMNEPALKELPPEPISTQPERLTVHSLVGLNTRIEDRLSDGLLRATVDRRLRRMPMSKVQEIVGEALRDWLKKHGYLN